MTPTRSGGIINQWGPSEPNLRWSSLVWKKKSSEIPWVWPLHASREGPSEIQLTHLSIGNITHNHMFILCTNQIAKPAQIQELRSNHNNAAEYTAMKLLRQAKIITDKRCLIQSVHISIQVSSSMATNTWTYPIDEWMHRKFNWH